MSESTPSRSQSSFDPRDAGRIRDLVREVVDRTLGEAAAAPVAAPAAAEKCEARSGPPARWVNWSPAARSACPAPPATTRAAEPAAPGAAGPDVAEAARPAWTGKGPVAIGGDHGAFRLKQQLKRYLEEELKYPVIDCGAHSEDSVDYPDIARDVALAVAEGRAWRGIVLDAMGIGSGMAANRIPGVLCAVCHDVASVNNAREHNDANLLSLGSRVVNPGEARRLVRTFLATEHGGGRHARRVAKIRALENLRNPIQRGT